MSLSSAERERRMTALQRLLEVEGLDALVLVANDYRGHKGALRWVADYNLVHRFGYALVMPEREPLLVLPENLALGRKGSWPTPTRYVRHTAHGLADALREIEPLGRVGIVGMSDVMRVGEYLVVREAFPQTEFVDASEAFERVRALKSDEELEGARESTRIAEQCFERLLEVARPGLSERAVGGHMFGRAYELGGEDFLFLTMCGKPGENGEFLAEFGNPGDRPLERGDQLVFSFELIGPLGYWMEFSRMIVFGEPSEVQTRLNQAVRAGMEAAAAAMLPGARPAEVQAALVDAVEAHGARSAYWSGHGLGQDVIEEPWIGLEVVQDRAPVAEWALAPSMVLSIHPFAIDRQNRGLGYMADTYITGEQGGNPISAVPLDLYVIG